VIKKFKRIFSAVACLFFLISTIACEKLSFLESKKEKTLKEDIAIALSYKTGDEFWFVYGLHKEGNISTNIRGN
jgi:hypothetical protein